MTKIQTIKAKIEKLIVDKQPLPDTEYFYCWDKTKYGIDNDEEKGVKKVKAGYLINYPERLKNFIFLPVL